MPCQTHMNQRSQPVSNFPNKLKNKHLEAQVKQEVVWDPQGISSGSVPLH